MSEWIKFDELDKTTHPDEDGFYMTYFMVDGVRNDVVIQKFDTTSGSFMTVDMEDYDSATTHWQPLPEPPTN